MPGDSFSEPGAVGPIRKEEVLEASALYRYHGCLFPVPCHAWFFKCTDILIMLLVADSFPELYRGEDVNEK